MRAVEPEVFLISRPQIDWDGVIAYLEAIGAASWAVKKAHDDAPGAQDLVEFAGRLCYRSWEPGLNPNVTRVREDQDAYLENIINVGHGSVLEHANFTFVLHNVSRVVTHEWVRHRHAAISQESLRFVRLTDIPLREVDLLFQDEDGEELVSSSDGTLREDARDLVERMEAFQAKAAKAHDLDNPTKQFKDKKMITSAMRRYAPIGLGTALVWTANVRAIRHVIEMRTAPGAEEEVRIVADQIATIMTAECPALFADYERFEDGTWDTSSRKV